MDKFLTQSPKSFKLDRKSKFASQLKSLISHQLLHFYPQFSDDVLAEYITVLVCNGKNQNQARDDLEAFLGGRTQEFVSWLWKLLLKNETQLIASLAPSRKDKTNANWISDNCQSQANSDSVNLMDEYGKIFCSPRQVCKSDEMEPPKDHHSPSPKETSSPFQSNVSQRKIANYDSSSKLLSSVRKYQTERVHDFEMAEIPASLVPNDSASVHASAFVENPSCCSKLSDKDPDDTLPRHPSSLPESAPNSGTHFSNVSKLSGSSLEKNTYLPLEAPSSRIKKPRQSVWDRLGKPQHDASSRSQTAGFHVMDKTQHDKKWSSQNSSLISKPAEQIGQVSPLLTQPRVEGSRQLRQVRQITQGGRSHNVDDAMRTKHVVMTDSEVPSTGKSEKKRQFGEIDSLTMEKRADNQFQKTSTSQSHKISEQVNDVRLQLCQIEKEMVKLRTKQISMEKYGNTNLLANYGVVKPTEVESRTVLVTNVHVEATKETLSMYFQKCGAVADVTLADRMPSARERSAYVTFQNKEAAERALRFSGASFYSKTIKVSRKGESQYNNSTNADCRKEKENAIVSLEKQHES